MSRITPSISVLTPEQIAQIHSYSLQVLSTTGVRVDSPKARELFSKALGEPVEGDRVRIPADMVEWAVNSAPATVDLYDRLGAKAITLGGEPKKKTHFGIGVTNLWYQHPLSDDVEPITREHLATAARLGNHLDSFDVVSTPGVLQGENEQHADLLATLEMVSNTTKPLILLVSEAEQFRAVLDFLQRLQGSLADKPFVVPYFNTITPLALNDATTDKIISSIEYGLPFIVSNYGMSGASTPITAGGTLVTLNAELLAGLCFAQIVKEGAAVLLGSLPSVFDMKTMITRYTPQTMLLNIACAEMMSHYAIPHVGTSGSGSGWGPDLLAGGTLWLNHITSCMGKVGLAPFVGGNFDSVAFSPATVIYADEIIRQVRLFAEGFDLNEDSVALDQIDEAGPGGTFLHSELTLELYRDMLKEHSCIWPGYSLDQWQEEGSPKACDLLRQHSAEVLESLIAPEDHGKIIEEGEALIRAR
jgi:trimethylamine--corrinoid protein Co-methyltransferase